MPSKHPKHKDLPGVDRMGRTPLHYAAADGDVGLVHKLLESGLSADAADDNGWTPLHFAAQSNAAEIVEVLLNAGASVDVQDGHGNTPLSTAVFNSRGDGAVIKILRAHGADPYSENNHLVSPLTLARSIANFDVAQFFLDLPPENDTHN